MVGMNVQDWLRDHPDVESVTFALCDINGVMRGKRLPASQIEKALNGGLRMPISACTLDIWGRDIKDSELVFESGDADGICQITERGILPRKWTTPPSAMLQMTLLTENGAPVVSDPRHALASMVERYAARGLTPVVATELEFYLTVKAGDVPDPATLPGAVVPVSMENVLSVSELDAQSLFFDEVYSACKEQGIPADAAISETGAGQFEINLLHRADALQAADDAVLFKNLVRGVAQQHGYTATFMAKPFGDQSGSGMHVHFSVLGPTGNNIFDDGTDEGSDVLKHAIGGLLEAMQDSMLIFAPHQNSYRRLRTGSHAPIQVAWGYENRTCAIRIPAGDPKARRIEHRVAGADANPYLVLTAILGAALLGIEAGLSPVPPVSGNVYEGPSAILPTSWPSAISAFETSTYMGRIFDPQMQRLFSQAKHQELDRFLSIVPIAEYQAYLEIV
ncbi:MAG: glutamine synthetase family protein [Pseudoruegeria sp.]